MLFKTIKSAHLWSSFITSNWFRNSFALAIGKNKITKMLNCILFFVDLSKNNCSIITVSIIDRRCLHSTSSYTQALCWIGRFHHIIFGSLYIEIILYLVLNVNNFGWNTGLKYRRNTCRIQFWESQATICSTVFGLFGKM